VNVGAAEAAPTIVSEIVIVRRIDQSVGAAGVDPIIVKSMVKSERVKTGIENVVLETERGREHVSAERDLFPLFCCHVLGTSSHSRRGPHHLGCE
jgi:hypothetical protein